MNRKLDIISIRIFVGSAAAVFAASGCMTDGDDGAEIGKAESALTAEMVISANQEIVNAAGLYYANPDIAANQYAEASLGYCNGVMIGPNVYFTAAHCGGGPTSISFRTYRNGSTASSDTESFTCDAMEQTYNDTDGVLFYCWPNAAGENPGDKYGYVDFDVTPPTVGQQIYSISANNWNTGPLPFDTRLFANGQITSVTDTGWFAPSSAPNTAVAMNLWGEPGMSGSPHFSAANHHMIIAPLSTAPPTGGWNRNALSMRDLLYWGYVNPGFDPSVQGPTVNVSLVTSLGLTPGSYYGWADKELDWEFDIQHDLERQRGETRRDWYFLGFDSQRRNALWDPTTLATFDVANRWAHISRPSGTGYSDALAHNKLNLAAGNYRVSLMTYTQASQFSSSLWVGLKSGSSFIAGEYVPNTVGSGWQMHTIEVTAPSDGLSLMFGVYGTADILVSAVSVVKSTAVMDFDTFDKRTNWRNDIDGSRAMVVPDGRVTGTPNWAVRVTTPATTGYPVRNRQLTLAGGRPYRICFDARREVVAGVPGWAQAELRVMSGGVLATSTTVYLSTSWTSSCTATFTPPSDDNNLQIRLVAGDSPFVLDNIAITAM
jgi:hypothetical protein